MKHTTLLLLATALSASASAQVVFTSDLEGWTGSTPDGWVGAKTNLPIDSIAQISTNPHGGSYAVQLRNPSATHKRFTTVQQTVTDGESYTVSFWVRGVGEIRTGLFDGRPGGTSGYATYNAYAVVNAPGTWQQVTQTVTAANDTTGAEFILSMHNTAGPEHLVVDDVNISVAGAPSPATIYAIQTSSIPDGSSDLQGSVVSTGGIVIATASQGYWVEHSTGGPGSGVYVFDSGNTPARGDSVTLTATVSEYFGLTELGGVGNFVVVSSANAEPAPVASLTSGVGVEALESVLVSTTDATCTIGADANGQWTVDDGSGPVFVNDLLYAYAPVVGSIYGVTGVVNYAFSEYKIEPRDVADIEVINGIEELSAATISLWPNPAIDVLHLDLGANLGSTDYAISDAQGRVVLNGRSARMQEVIDVSGLANGAYTFTIRNEAGSYSSRVTLRR